MKYIALVIIIVFASCTTIKHRDKVVDLKAIGEW